MEKMKMSPSKTDFDTYADNYEALHKSSIKPSGFEPTYFDEHKIRVIHQDYQPLADTTLRILNFGCGIGKSEQYINKYFKNCRIDAVDVSEESIQIAAERNKRFDNITFRKFDTLSELSFENKFDIIFVANVFHHIPDELHLPILEGLHCFLNKKGVIYIFEHNPINPLTRKVFNTCEFDVGCTMIPSKRLKALSETAGFKKIRIHFVLFFPKFLSFLSGLEKYMTFIPIGAQYYLKAEKHT